MGEQDRREKEELEKKRKDVGFTFLTESEDYNPFVVKGELEKRQEGNRKRELEDQRQKKQEDQEKLRKEQERKEEEKYKWENQEPDEEKEEPRVATPPEFSFKSLDMGLEKREEEERLKRDKEMRLRR